MPENLGERVEAIKQLLRLFRVERAVYLTVTILSLVVLLSTAISLYIRHQAGYTELIGLFSSSGAVTYTAGRLLSMWNEAMRLLGSGAPKDEA